ncbi:hypothetical protein BDZ94DRAFT_1324510 [Collybia nuda]|uniref:Acetoin reductase family protein n=1 Tax=Collybia nuda TaxID=64659 RepID=A0A9P6CBQ3_9AGAR|nr:hypothetical protein BDZ94DRAFT_1324510 [Collybia nuda]
MDLKGAALVTGAARGIGRAVALRLAEDGFDVALNDLEYSKGDLEALSQEISLKFRKTIITLGDVSREADVIRMVDSTVQDLGGLDVMVANAGIVSVVTPFPDTTIEDWDHTLGINARGIFFCYKYAAQQMIKQGRGGRIIGASSVAGKQGYATITPYAASKFAVRGLTQSAAKDLGPYNITVNTYAPGFIDTPMLTALGDGLGGAEAYKAKRIQQTAVRDIGKPEDIASIVSYLVSKESHFITGQSISVNGGIYFD